MLAYEEAARGKPVQRERPQPLLPLVLEVACAQLAVYALLVAFIGMLLVAAAAVAVAEANLALLKAGAWKPDIEIAREGTSASVGNQRSIVAPWIA